MERYELIKVIGGSSYGIVWLAFDKYSCETVAIKKLKRKYRSFEDCMNLPEVKSLRRMNHPNIVRLKSIIKEHDVLFFIFEYMDFSLFEVMKRRDKPFSESQIRNICFQLFDALDYVHRQRYFHRDLKPENLLVSNNVIKVADFGLAREITKDSSLTEYVTTRWYRAPKVLLQSSSYGPPVDMWAMGAIMGELFTLNPLFPGTSVIGSPCQNSWVDGLRLADRLKFQFLQYSSSILSMLIPSASVETINLISSLCSWDPNKRPTAAEALQHPFFQPCCYIPASPPLSFAAISKIFGTGTQHHQNDGKNYSLYSWTNISSICSQRRMARHKLQQNHDLGQDNSMLPARRQAAQSKNLGEVTYDDLELDKMIAEMAENWLV